MVTALSSNSYSYTKNQSLDSSRPANSSQRAEEMFNKIDANEDGKIDKTEMQEMPPPHGGPKGAPDGGPNVDQIFSDTDTDENGTIDKTEFTEGAKKMEEKMKNGRQAIQALFDGSSADEGSSLSSLLNSLTKEGATKDDSASLSSIKQLLTKALAAYGSGSRSNETVPLMEQSGNSLYA